MTSQNPIGLRDERESARIIVAKLEQAAARATSRDYHGVARALSEARQALADLNRETSHTETRHAH